MDGIQIRVISPPPGDAPLWVREAWVGITMVAIGVSLTPTGTSTNVVSGELSEDNCPGFYIPTEHALERLFDHNRRAWKWWSRRDNSKDYLVFHMSVCKTLHPIPGS